MTYELIRGDCVQAMACMETASVDAVVCDPPYGIRFMGKAWDAPDIANLAERETKTRAKRPRKLRRDTGKPYNESVREGPNAQAGKYDRAPSANRAFQAWTEAWAREAFRVLKPGGHLLSSCSTRTYHRMASGIEDAGFEIRDMVAWMYGSGFPKSLDVSKAIDKAAGAERDSTGPKVYAGGHVQNHGGGRQGYHDWKGEGVHEDSAPATAAAQAWDGWGTALKPAHEPIVVARKPLGGTVAANVQEHGTGALNVDGCRIETGDTYSYPNGPGGKSHHYSSDKRSAEVRPNPTESNPLGRWPANVVLDEEAAGMLDAQSGDRPTGLGGLTRKNDDRRTMSGPASHDDRETIGYGDSGGASRFFYCAKASRAERNAGGILCTHPTVKPVALMRWLVRLVTPPGGLVLDPFLGSGTTGVACRLEGFRFIGIDREWPYIGIARLRILNAHALSELDGAPKPAPDAAGQLTMFANGSA